jgi:hypothetical protein
VEMDCLSLDEAFRKGKMRNKMDCRFTRRQLSQWFRASNKPFKLYMLNTMLIVVSVCKDSS